MAVSRGLWVLTLRGTTIAMFWKVRFRDLLMSAAAVAVLMALIALTDDRVRERMRDVNAYSVSNRVASSSARVESATAKARDIAFENGALTVMVIAGAVLFVFMLRT